MKDFLRKLLASLLCICMIGSGLPVSAIAEAMQDSATPPEQQSVSGSAEEQGGQSAQTQASEEQGGTSAQIQEIAGEKSPIIVKSAPFNLIESGIMPTAAEEQDDFKVELSVSVGNKGNGTYNDTVVFYPAGDDSNTQRLYFKLTIENESLTQPLVLHLENTLDWNGTRPLQTSPNRFLYNAGTTSKSKPFYFQDSYYVDKSNNGATLTVNSDLSTLTIPANTKIELSNKSKDDGSGYIDTKENNSLPVSNSHVKDTVVIWKEGTNKETDAITLTALAKTADYEPEDTGNAKITLGYEQGEDQYTANGTVKEGDEIAFFAQIQNPSSTAGVTLKLSDVFMVANKHFDDRLNIGLADGQEDGISYNAESSELFVPAGKTATVKTDKFTVPYVLHPNDAGESHAPQLEYSLTAESSGDTFADTDGALKLDIQRNDADKAPQYTVITEYYIDGQKVSHETEKAVIEETLAYANDATNYPAQISYHVVIENNSGTDKLYFCLAHENHNNGVFTPPSFSNGGEPEALGCSLKEKDSPDYNWVEGKENEELWIAPGKRAELIFNPTALAYIKDAEKESFTFAFNVLEIRKQKAGNEAFDDVHGYTSVPSSVKLTYEEGVFGYCLSIPDTDFPGIKLQYPDAIPEVHLWKMDDNPQQLYLVGKTARNAKKYVHAQNNTITYYGKYERPEQEITIIDAVPVVTDEDAKEKYQFLCWYDKNKNPDNKKIFKPGDTIHKNDKPQHSLDAAWVSLEPHDSVFVYDGKDHTLENVELSLNGENQKYDFYDNVYPCLGTINVSYKVKDKSGKTILDVPEEKADIKTPEKTSNADDKLPPATITLPPLTGCSNVGVYTVEVTVHFYNSYLDAYPDSIKSFTRTATLTILPRPVVLQVASGSVDWENGTLRTLTDVDGVEYSIGSAFDESGALKTQAENALSDAIENIGVSADDVDGMLANYKSATDDRFAPGEGFAAGFEPDVKYYPNTGRADDAVDSVIGPGTFNAIIANIAALQAAKKTAAAAPVVSAEGNYVFIGLPGELNIKAPTLSSIEITKKVVDASFTEGTFTFTVAEVDAATGKETNIEFVPETETLYVMKGMSVGAATGEPKPITLTVTKGTEETPSASVVLKVPVGKTYVVRETAASDFTPNDGRTLENYAVTYDGTVKDGAEVTIAADAKDDDKASVTVTNTANFYFVQNYVSDLDDKGNPVKHDDDKNVLEGYPGYVADGDPARYTLTNETTYASIHDGAKESYDNKNPYVPQTFTDQSIDSPNAAGVKEDDDSDGKGGEAKYTFKYDDSTQYIVLKTEGSTKTTYNANETYLRDAAHSGDVKPGDTVNIFWDRDLKYSAEPDGRYVDTKVDPSNKTSANAIRQSQITYGTDYALWTSLNIKSHTEPDVTNAIVGKVVKDSWQQVNAIDLTFEINKNYGEKSTDFNANTPRYIFNTVVTTQVNGRNPPKAVTITDNKVVIDNVKGGSTDTKLYLTPLIKVKYFVDDGSREPKAVDPKTYTLKAPVVGNATNSAVGTTYAFSFTVPEHSVVGNGGEYVQSGRTDTEDDFWLLKTYAGQAGGERLKVGDTHEIEVDDLYHYSKAGVNGIHVDPDGYLVVALYLTPAKKTWEVTKSVEVYDGDTKLEDSAVATFGNTLKYTVTVKNTGNVLLTKLYLRDDAIATPTEGKDIELSIFGNDEHKIGVTVESSKEGVTRTFKPDPNYPNFGTINQIDPDETVTLTYSYVVGGNVKHVSNSVTVDDDDYPDEDPNDTTKPVTPDKVETPIRNWSVAKSIAGVTDKNKVARDPDAEGNYTLRVGDTITYAVTIKNTGDADLDELTVKEDFLRNGHTASASALKGPTLTSDKEDSTATFAVAGGKLKNLHKGETVTLTYTYEVVSADQTLSNAATVADSEGGHPRTSEEVVTPVTSFKVEKYVLVNGKYQGARAVVKTGDELTYEVVVTNTGSVDIKKLLITDTMDELESRTRPKVPDVTFTKKSGSGDINGNEITNLPAGESITLQWLGSDFGGVKQPYTVDDNNVHIRNTVTVKDDALSPKVETAFADALVKNWDMTKTVTIERGGETVTDTVAQVGDKLYYAITVTNTGAEPLTLFVEDTMDGVRFDGSEGAVDPHSPFRSGVKFDTSNAPDAVCSIVTIDGKRYVKITNLEGVDEATYQQSSVTISYSFTVTQPLSDLSKGLHNTAKVHGAEDPKQPETTKPLILESDPYKETSTTIEAWTLDKQLTAVNGVAPSEPTFGKDAEDKEDENALVYPAVRVGDVLTYVVTVENTGSADIAAIAVDDKLTGGANAMTVVFDSDSTTTTFNGNTIHNLPAGAKATLTYTYKVAAGDTTLVNAVTAYQPEAPQKTQEKTVTTPIKDWTVIKEVYKGETPLANEAEVAVGDKLTYVVTVKNTGTVELKGLTLKDVFTNGEGELDGMKHLVMDNDESADAEYAAGTWTIQPGGKLVLKADYTVQPASQNPERNADTQLTNTITVTDDDKVTKTQKVTTHVRGWKVTKTVSADTVLPGTHLTYSIQIENTGNVTLDLTLEDVFTKDKTTEDITANLKPDTHANNAAGTEATFDDGNKKITGLEPGKTFTLYWNYDVPGRNEETVEQLVNTVTVDDDPILDKAKDPNDSFPPQSDTAETLVKNWSVAKAITGVTYLDSKGQEAKRAADTDGKYTLRPGDKVTYQVTVKNTGDTELTLYVEDSLFIEKIAGEDWESKKEALEKALTVKLNGAEWKNWALFEDNSEGDHDGDCLIQLKKLPVGATVTLTYTFTVPESSKGNEDLFTKGVNNLVYVHANDPKTDPETDPKPEHNSENDPHAQTESRLEAWSLDKAITKVMRGEGDDKEDVTSKFMPSDDAGTTKYTASVQLGDVVTYTITIKNEGSTTIDQLNFVDIFNRTGQPNGGKPLTLDDMKSYGSSKGMNGAKISTDNDGIHITGLTPEETFTLTYETTVLSTDKDALSNAVTVTRKGDTTSKEKIVEVNVRKTVSWSVEKTVEGMSSEEFINGLQCAKVGETLTYKITVTNTGSETLSGLKLEDVFNGNGLKGQQPPIEQVDPVPTPEAQRYYDKETHIINNLGAGQSVTLAYDYTVVASDIELVNTATVSQPGGAGTSQTSEVTTPVETTPAWKVTKEVYKGKYTGKEGDVKLENGDAVSVGDELTYVITVENTGNTSLRLLSVKDVFGGEEIQKELVRFSQGVAYYNETRAEIQTLDAGRSIVLTYAHKVTEDDKAAGLFNEVTVTLPSEMETDKDKDHHAEVGNPVSAWTITKELTASDGMLGTRAVQIGDTMTYTITIANNGSAEIESLTVEDELIVTGWQYPQLDDMRLSADAPEGVTFTRSSVKDKNGKDTPANTGVLEHLGAGQTAKIECTYKVPGGVYYTSNAARAYPTGRKDEEQKTDPVIMPMYAVVTVHKIWTDADGKRLGANELKQLIGNTEVKFDILRANRTDSAFKPMTDANGVPYGVTLSANETPTWTRDFRSVVRLGNSPDEDDYRLYDVQERGVQTDKDGKTQYVMLNGHKFYYGMSYNFDGKTFNFTFTNELEGATSTTSPTPGTTSSASATPTPTPSAYVPFTPTPGPAADAKYRVTKTAVNPPARGYYVEGETVQYSIRVQNTGMVPIDALTITDHLSGVTFTSGAGYDLTGAREAFIDHLSAGMSVEIYASYVVTAADVKRGCVTNTVSGDGGTGPDGRPASGNAAEATVPTNDSTYDVTVHYLYLTDGTTAAPDDKINRLRPGDAYRFSCPTIDGYYASSLTVTGTMPAHNVEITVYYVPEDLLPSNGRGGPGLILLDEYGIPLGVGRVMLNVGDCFE